MGKGGKALLRGIFGLDRPCWGRHLAAGARRAVGQSMGVPRECFKPTAAIGGRQQQHANSIAGRVPIVFSMGEDAVKEGVVASLNRPGGNVTGYGQPMR
jgi:hypothetical protein